MAGANFSLMGSNEIVGEYNDLLADLLTIRKQFLAWKHTKAKENYDQADVHATFVESQCASRIATFWNNIRVAEGFGHLSKEISTRFKDKPPEVFQGGGDGGGVSSNYFWVRGPPSITTAQRVFRPPSATRPACVVRRDQSRPPQSTVASAPALDPLPHSVA